MKRRLATALASAALLALSVTAGLDAGAQTTNQAAARTGERTTRVAAHSCPIHPEIKARSAGRCSKCRAEERKIKSARERDAGNVTRPQVQQVQVEAQPLEQQPQEAPPSND